MGTKRRKLQDLYITGREFAYSDGTSDEEPIVVWMQKLNSIETETCTRRANAARSRVSRAVADHESEDWQNAYDDVSDLERDTLIDLVIVDEVGRRLQVAQAEIAAEEEWSKDDYLQGLNDAWFGLDGTPDLKYVYEVGDEDDPRYPEAKRVFEELKRFEGKVNSRLEAEREAIRKDHASSDLNWLREQAVVHNLSLRGTAAWLTEYRRSQLYFGVREVEDHKQRYFEDRDEVDQLHPTLLELMEKHYSDLVVDAAEGKDSPPIQDSSPPSEQLDEVETAASSGQSDASQ